MDEQPGANRAAERRLITEARAAVRTQWRTGEFAAAPYQHATELLESLTATSDFVDERVQLALEISAGTWNDRRPDLARRALSAALPAGGKLKDKKLERRWYTRAGLLESTAGNVEQALKHKLIALRLCGRTKDALGFYTEWAHFAYIAAGAGLYQDAVDYATLAIESAVWENRASLRLHGLALLARARAFMRLGRLNEAAQDLAAVFLKITAPHSAAVQEQMLTALYLSAEVHLELGDPTPARASLYAASTWAQSTGSPVHLMQVARARARLTAFEGDPKSAISSLRELLKQAEQIEATFGTPSTEGIVGDTLYTLEHVCRQYGDADSANVWLGTLGTRLRKNADKMLQALARTPFLSGQLSVAAKMSEVDRYLRSKSDVTASPIDLVPTWGHLVGLAASASSVEDASKEHGVRVARLARWVAQDLGAADDLQQGIAAGCLIHDIGKVGVPSFVALKSTPLSSEEQALYDAHPAGGAELIGAMTFPHLNVVRNIVQFHHHPYQGGAAQSAPKGDAIPLEARIAAVCNYYDERVNGRPRRPSVSSSEALQEIFELRSRLFDPKVVDVFVELIRSLQRSHPDLQTFLAQEAETSKYFATQRELKTAADLAGE